MVRYFKSMTGNVIDEIVIQDETGIFRTVKHGQEFSIVRIYPEQTIRIFIGKGRKDEKKILTTSKEFIEYYRQYNMGIYNSAIPDKIKEDKRTKEEIIKEFSYSWGKG